MPVIPQKRTRRSKLLSAFLLFLHSFRYKVINNKGTVSEKTRETVLAALKEYHYTPNNNARNLAKNRSYDIALINYVSADAIYFASTIEKGIRQAIDNYGDHGLVINRYTSPGGAAGEAAFRSQNRI